MKNEVDQLDVLVLCAGSVGLRNFRELNRQQLDTVTSETIRTDSGRHIQPAYPKDL